MEQRNTGGTIGIPSNSGLGEHQSINQNNTFSNILDTVYDSFIFTAVLYAVGLFVDTTNNYQQTNSSNPQTSFLCQRHDIKFQ